MISNQPSWYTYAPVAPSETEINIKAMDVAADLIKSGVRVSDDPVELAGRIKTFLMTVDKNSQEV